MSVFGWIAVVVGLFLLGFIVSYFIVNELLFKRFFGKADKNLRENSLTDAHYLPVKDEMIAEANRLEEKDKKTFCVKSIDGLSLYADLYGKKGNTLIIMAHGLHSVPSYNFGIIANMAIDRGYDVLLIDQRAHGRSGGKYSYYGKREGEDLLLWTDLAEKKLGYKNVFLYGVSMGAAAIGVASDRVNAEVVKGGIMDCGFISAWAIANYLVKTKNLPGFIFMDYLKMRAKFTLDLDIKRDKVTERIKNSKIPILFIHGEADDVAPIDGTRELYTACGAKKELITVAGAGHTTAVVIGKEKVTEKFFDFIKKNS